MFKKNILLSILIIFIFTSCSSIYTKYSKKIKSYFSSSNSSDYLIITRELTENLCEKINQDSVIYITDYVDEENLKNKSKLGFLLASQTKVNVLNEDCTSNVKIQDLQLAKNLKISKNGSRILSRDINEIKVKNLQDDKQILVGSYILTQNEIIFFLKLMNLKTGNIIASTTTSRVLSEEFRNLQNIKTHKKKEKEQKEKQIYTPLHL